VKSVSRAYGDSDAQPGFIIQRYRAIRFEFTFPVPLGVPVEGTGAVYCAFISTFCYACCMLHPISTGALRSLYLYVCSLWCHSAVRSNCVGRDELLYDTVDLGLDSLVEASVLLSAG
jgi:hypothetical protein